MPQQEPATEVRRVADVLNPNGQHPVVLVCEHASNFIPAEFYNLGLPSDALNSHIAWDPGALQTAVAISSRLDAPLVHGNVSRLVYDCNRPPEAHSAIPDKSESTTIPGNQNLDQTNLRTRADTYYRPFESLVSDVLDSHGKKAVIVTIHSFTPLYLGQKRDVEIGILHDTDSRLADAILNVAHGYEIQRNQPYGPQDGVTHTLTRHALPRGLLNVMIEIRNDLISTPDQCERMGEVLCEWITDALRQVPAFPVREMAK